MSGFSIWASREGKCVMLAEVQAAFSLVVPVSKIVLSAFAKGKSAWVFWYVWTASFAQVLI
jgi:hypothetical protein